MERADADIHEVLVRRVEQYSAKKRFSINMLADFAGLSRGYVSTIMRRKSSPSLRTIAKLAAALEVDVRDLLEPLPDAGSDPPARRPRR